MPKPVEIEVFQIARTQVDREAVRRWLDFLGVSPEFELPDVVTDPALLIALAAKRCYKSFEPGLNPNVTKVRAEYGEYLDNVMSQGHGSVLEHAVFTFAIENVSRVFTGEMNRHRAGWAISEASMRYIRFGECIPYWEPTCISGENQTWDEQAIKRTLLDLLGNKTKALKSPWLGNSNTRLPYKKQLTRELFKLAFEQQELVYSVLERIWAEELAPESKFAGKKQITSMMRRIVGMGCATGGVWTGNVRALRHVLTMRCAPSAEEEIMHVFSRVAKLMRDSEPMLFGDFYQDENGFWRPKYVKV